MSEVTDNVAPPTDQPNVTNTPDELDTNQSDHENSTFDFQPLETFQGPVNEEDVLMESEGAMVDNPVFYSSHSFRNNQDLMTRRAKALELGGRSFKRQLAKLTSEHFSRRLLNDVFPKESSILNDLINYSRVATTTGYAYTVKREYYRQILSALYQIRKTHGDLILAEGYPIPELPLWGRKDDITQFHLENEYEILAICFRTEVESFLITFDKHYNFLTGTPRSADLIVDVPPRDLPPHFPSAPTTPSLGSVREEVIAGPKRSTVAERADARLETGGPRSRRHSNLYNFGSNVLGDRLRKSHPEGTPRRALHTNKLREVLGDTELPQDELPNDAINRSPLRNVKTKSDDLERNSTSTRVFQNRRISTDNEPSDLENEEADGKHFQGSKNHAKGRN